MHGRRPCLQAAPLQSCTCLAQLPRSATAERGRQAPLLRERSQKISLDAPARFMGFMGPRRLRRRRRVARFTGFTVVLYKSTSRVHWRISVLLYKSTYEEGLNLVGGTGEGGDFGAECISVLRYKYTYEEGLYLEDHDDGERRHLPSILHWSSFHRRSEPP